jgi:hypothetical protein
MLIKIYIYHAFGRCNIKFQSNIKVNCLYVIIALHVYLDEYRQINVKLLYNNNYVVS